MAPKKSAQARPARGVPGQPSQSRRRPLLPAPPPPSGALREASPRPPAEPPVAQSWRPALPPARETDVRGGRRTAGLRNAAPGSAEAGAAPQPVEQEAAADPSRVEAAESQPAEAEAARGDTTPRDRRGRTSAENTYTVAQVYSMDNSGDEDEVAQDESRHLPVAGDEGEEGSALRDSDDEESQVDWGAGRSPPEAGEPSPSREEVPEMIPDRPEVEEAVVGSLGPTTAESVVPSVSNPDADANAPAPPYHS